MSYDELTEDQVKQLSDAVNALSEPLSKLTAAVVRRPDRKHAPDDPPRP